MHKEIVGSTKGKGRRIAIVVSRFNELITDALLRGALAALEHSGVAASAITVVRVPGAFEIPPAAWRAAASHDGVVCLGAVIAGETDHYRHVCERVATGIGAAIDDTGVAMAFGVLTCTTEEQAAARAGSPFGDPASNKGAEAALVVLEMIDTFEQLDKLASLDDRAHA